MNLDLQNQTAIVVGGAQGIGLAIAEAFAAEGCRVGLLDRNPDVTTVAGDLATRSGADCLGRVADVTDSASLEAAAAEFADALGRIDHVVYAAGAGSGKFGFPFWNIDPEDWARVLDINLTGAVRTAHVFAPRLLEGGDAPGSGRTLLFLVSVAGQIGSQTDPPYSAAKAGLINFTQCAARDLAARNIRVNALSPGMVKTTLNQSVWAASQARLPEAERRDYDAWAAEKIAKVSPLGRWQEPAEYGALAVFLASRHARNITGQTLNIDGGQVMHS
ncbi:MAG: SDR family oxidoreductase [Akkermansiaceae bacterium]|nr:SDR family oxidoreductase [Akkermansiaceae bacterium]MCP5550192.1 SDR family oxidoreductase [Akkermansiaceae bacterium]